MKCIELFSYCRKIAPSMLLLLFSCIYLNANAQFIPIKGTVTSEEDGLSIPGVAVQKEGTSSGTITDVDGNYTITALQGEVLVFRFIGMQTVKRTVNKSPLNIIMKSQQVDLNEVVVIGYGTQKKKEVTGAVSQVKSETLNKLVTSDLGAALQGQIAGVNVMASSGAPGASSNIQIRGISSINGVNEPLYVVDGIPQSGDPRLSNSEIETLDILKDAASAAIYGTRGAGGVILITTKQGKAGQMKISVESSGGIQNITSGLPLQNFTEHMYTRILRYRNTQRSNDSEIFTPLSSNRYGFFNDTHLMETLQNNNAPIQNHSINITGGKENLSYSVMGNYFNQKGVLINSGFDRLNMRGNTMFKSGKWSVNTSMGFAIENQEYEPWQLLYEAYRYYPYQPEIDLNQIDNASLDVANDPAAWYVYSMMTKLKQKNNRKGNNFNGNVQINFEVLNGLNLTTRVGGNFGNNTTILINPIFNAYDAKGDILKSGYRSKIRNTADRSSGITWEGGINYQKSLGKHNFKLLAVISSESYTYNRFFAEKFDLISNDVTVIGGATSDPNVGSSDGNWNQDKTNTLIGILGRLQYDYNGRYLLSISARRDGSSRFAKENRWGTFPSVSVGWNVADEAFWVSIIPIVNTFKIRGSYGTTGNQNFSDYSYSSTIGLGYDYAFGQESNDQLGFGYTQTGYSNALVKWETTTQTNVGIDLGLFNNQLTLSADFYDTKKKDMLFPLLLPASAGAGGNANIILNVGDMNNRGAEVTIGYRKEGRFSWGINGTFTKNVNRITRMSGSNKISYFSSGTVVDGVDNPDRVTALKEGYEAGAFFVMPTNGIVNTTEKLAAFQKLVPTAKMGDLLYMDNNKDGRIDDSDRVYGGSGSPDFEVGMNINAEYAGFDLSMQWYLSYGNEVINGGRLYSYMYNTHKDLVYQWSEMNPLSPIPADRGTDHLNARGWADKWVEDGSFLRLRNITLGYTFPKPWLRKLKINNIRIYLATDNPLTITKYQGFDPEVGNDGLATRGLDKGNYPVSSKYRGGIQFDF